ncbi:MAG: SDR family oxidoreductase, partial [Acidimicrobiales bacterium]|nr:SDR family oxidoreductase [Acidimicrobiales bacterium]
RTPAWAGSGITLNAVAPGGVETPLVQARREDPVTGGAVDDFPIPVGRTGRPDELAALVQFLLGPDARFICGSLIFADGGTDALLRADAQPTSMDAF